MSDLRQPINGEFSAAATQPVRLLTGIDTEVYTSKALQSRLVSHRVVEADGAAVQVQGFIVPANVPVPAIAHLFLNWTGVANESFHESGSIEAPIMIIPPNHRIIMRSVTGNANYFPTFFKI